MADLTTTWTWWDCRHQHCHCGAANQTAQHIASKCPLHSCSGTWSHCRTQLASRPTVCCIEDESSIKRKKNIAIAFRYSLFLCCSTKQTLHGACRASRGRRLFECVLSHLSPSSQHYRFLGYFRREQIRLLFILHQEKKLLLIFKWILLL